MTQAKIAPSPAEGHGLTERITQPHYSAYTKGEPIDMVPALVLLKVSGHGGHDTANGRVNTVKYELAKVEPFLEAGDRENALWQIQSMYEARTSTGAQRPLPLGLPNEERRQFLMERMEAWADERGITGAELDARWREEFGIGPDEDWSYGDSGVPADYRRASVAHLLQFADTVIEQPVDENDGDDGGDDLDDEQDTETEATSD